MKQITLNIPDNKYSFFLELVKHLEFLQVEEGEQQALEELQNSLKQVKLMQEGKLPKQSAKDFLNEPKRC